MRLTLSYLDARQAGGYLASLGMLEIAGPGATMAFDRYTPVIDFPTDATGTSGFGNDIGSLAARLTIRLQNRTDTTLSAVGHVHEPDRSKNIDSSPTQSFWEVVQDRAWADEPTRQWLRLVDPSTLKEDDESCLQKSTYWFQGNSCAHSVGRLNWHPNGKMGTGVSITTAGRYSTIQAEMTAIIAGEAVPAVESKRISSTCVNASGQESIAKELLILVGLSLQPARGVAGDGTKFGISWPIWRQQLDMPAARLLQRSPATWKALDLEVRQANKRYDGQTKTSTFIESKEVTL